MENNILVTVRVVSYNAAKTILETLESIKAQTYQNIELIVSDDCSKDETVQIARRWIDKNKERFVRTVLLTVPQNTGVCANMNRSLKASRGVWIKGIAADDILLPNCIEDVMAFVKQNPEAQFVTTLQRVYNETFEEKNYENTTGYISEKLVQKDARAQLMEVAFSHNICAPATMCSRALLENIGGYDDRYGYEDHPLYISMLEHGYKIFFLPKETVGYRIHNSTMHVGGKLFNSKFLELSKRFRKERCFPFYTWRQKLSLRLLWTYQDTLDLMHLNRATKFNSWLFHKIHALTLFIAR